MNPLDNQILIQNSVRPMSEFEQWKYSSKYLLTLHDPDDDQEITETLSYNELLYRAKEYGFADRFNELIAQMYNEYNGWGAGCPSIHTSFLDIYMESIV